MAVAKAAEEARRRRDLAALLITNGEVVLDHFAGLDSEAASVLLRAIETAIAQFDQNAGVGIGRADDANVVFTVRPGIIGRTVTVELAEGKLTGPDMRIAITSTDSTGVRGGVGDAVDRSTA